MRIIVGYFPEDTSIYIGLLVNENLTSLGHSGTRPTAITDYFKDHFATEGAVYYNNIAVHNFTAVSVMAQQLLRTIHYKMGVCRN